MINESVFKEFKNFVEYELGLYEGAYNNYPHDGEYEFTPKNFKKILNDNNVEKFNNKEFFDIPEVIIFMEYLVCEGFFLWEDPVDYVYKEDTKTFIMNHGEYVMGVEDTIDMLKKDYNKWAGNENKTDKHIFHITTEVVLEDGEHSLSEDTFKEIWDQLLSTLHTPYNIKKGDYLEIVYNNITKINWRIKDSIKTIYDFEDYYATVSKSGNITIYYKEKINKFVFISF